MKKVIITGGAGYIGSHTATQIVEAGYTPIVVDDLSNASGTSLDGSERILGYRPTFHQVDCKNEQALRKVFEQEGDVHGVVHFAAFKSVSESVEQPLKYYLNNVGSTATLLKVMHEKGVKQLVFSSSCTVYGTPESSPVDELARTGQATNPYGYTKVICEQMLHDMYHAHPEMDIVMLRYFNPIGAHPSAEIGELPIGVPTNLVPYITQTAAGIREELVIHGNDYNTDDGTAIRDFIHVMDLADAHVRALSWMSEKGAPGIEAFNLGTGKGVSVKEAVDTFQDVTGKKLPHRYGPRRAGDIEQIWADTAKSAKVLGWHTKHDLADALSDAWRWQCRLREMKA